MKKLFGFVVICLCLGGCTNGSGELGLEDWDESAYHEVFLSDDVEGEERDSLFFEYPADALLGDEGVLYYQGCDVHFSKDYVSPVGLSVKEKHDDGVMLSAGFDGDELVHYSGVSDAYDFAFWIDDGLEVFTRTKIPKKIINPKIVKKISGMF